ncbi:MAG: YfgM family protein [Hafnia sp.]|uniref:YfgM family protein n=1 Tax=Obesumbacterium proteus TaxID=82983 RepID=UPI00103384CB|nr:YfgM family protein [Obesumbacterium proteus]MDN5969108.1 YfgM family protein [Enterobacterales bacterium]MDN5987164.1 YfgM family protein [Hafniaceae bacterium]MCE9885218.1 YfgM family protein [Obesumbacterium proteus]MCE9917042.1 YfgM family protein [Obesumbacterium proteus]MCE9930389.1 YfgM family protein [Obesumbacterium proteus]
MEVYSTENEQVDALRRFFIENGKALAIGVVIGIGALLGWRYWQSHQQAEMTGASQSYQQASEALTGGKADGVALAEKFIEKNANNYGVLAALQLAQHEVDQKNFAKAEQQLAWAQGQTKDENLKSLIDLRLARVQLQENKLDDALKTLDLIKATGWVAMAQDIRGDVLVKKGDVKGAREAYSKGLASDASQSLQGLLRMKLNNLSN